MFVVGNAIKCFVISLSFELLFLRAIPNFANSTFIDTLSAVKELFIFFSDFVLYFSGVLSIDRIVLFIDVIFRAFRVHFMGTTKKFFYL